MKGVSWKVNLGAPYMKSYNNLHLIIPQKMILGPVYTKLKLTLDYTYRKKFSLHIEIKLACSKYCGYWDCFLTLLCLT